MALICNTLTPNPATNIVEACFTLPANAHTIKLKLIDEYNQIGMLLEEKSVGSGEICKTFNLSNYNTGTYRVVLEHSGSAVVGKHLLLLK